MCEGVRESVWKYYHWIFKLVYLHFCTQHVWIGSNGGNSPNCVKIAWNCTRECVKVRESITVKFLSLSTCNLIPNILKFAQKRLIYPKLHEIVWKSREIAWRRAWNCGKLRIQHALAKPVPTIPQTPQTEWTMLRNQHNRHTDVNTDTSVLYTRIPKNTTV